MRLTFEQIATIRAIVAEFAGSDASVRLFGSRLDDAARGGDVVLLAPNLMRLPIHDEALRTGVKL
jgi:predicted nucleotidyltransferase